MAGEVLAILKGFDAADREPDFTLLHSTILLKDAGFELEKS